MILAPYIDIIISPGYLLELGQITFFKFQGASNFPEIGEKFVAKVTMEGLNNFRGG